MNTPFTLTPTHNPNNTAPQTRTDTAESRTRSTHQFTINGKQTRHTHARRYLGAMHLTAPFVALICNSARRFVVPSASTRPIGQGLIAYLFTHIGFHYS